MFLDPEPKRGSKQGMSAPSGFFSSQRPIESPRDHRTTIRRKPQPLAERTQSQINQQNPWTNPANPTVRLVRTPPAQAHDPASDAEDPDDYDRDHDDEDEIAAIKSRLHRGHQVLPISDAHVKPASVSHAGLPGFSSKSVSDSPAAPNEAPPDRHSDTTSLFDATPAHADAATHAAPGSEWHRRHGSTGNHSTSSTLRTAEDSGVFGLRGEKGDTRLSEVTTLRDTPTPTEQDLRQRLETDDSAAGRASIHTLETLQEASPERSTLRAVEASSSPSEESGSVDEQSQADFSSSPNVQIFSSPSTTVVSPAIPGRTSSWRAYLDSSPQSVLYRPRSLSQSPTRLNEANRESVATFEGSDPLPSSPNYVAYSPESSRPRSRSSPLHHTYSAESIDSRIQYPSFVRPETSQSIASTTSWSSPRPSSPDDTLAPLYVPKKRLRHKAGIASLNAAANASFASGSDMADEDIDTLPYPREPFTSHLSTIASEGSRATSQQLSHFSLGSGVLTGDDSSSIPLSGTWPRRRRESAPVSSFASDAPAPSSSEEDAGDMTLGVFREESAKPQPLFQPRSGAAPGERRYDSRNLPPLPPMPRSRDGDEHADTVGDLHTPQLREKRSGYSLRRRSNSTPSRGHSKHMSRSESERWSQASSLFPTWAKNFYGQGAALMSASKISLSAPPATPQRGRNNGGHSRNDSQWTERSITSRLGTGYSELESASPTSSHFLPSIFRPRTRRDKNLDASSRSRKSKRGRPSRDSSSRPDSLQIFSDPLPQNAQAADPNTLPSGHPKYGSLKDGSEQPNHRPLPRKYSKQKHWNEMSFPRPMTKDRLSDFHIDPHLAPTNRTSRISLWRAPSFVESLDTLLKSRSNRQILLFALGFLCPLLWMLGAVLPIPRKPVSAEDFQKACDVAGGSEEDIQTAMMKHEAGDAEKRWREEKAWMKGRWWRGVNRVMSVVGVLVIAAIVSSSPFLLEHHVRRCCTNCFPLQIALAVIATH